MTTARVIGAGLSGLAAAWCLAGRGVEVEVVEAAAGPGGLIHTHHSPFGLVETAANAFVWTPTVERWFGELQLAPCFPLSSSRARYIWREGHARRWPLTGLETAALGLRLAGATLTFARAPRPAESVQRWGDRVLGRAATRWLLGPALHGIYAAAPADLSAPLVIGGRRRGRRELAAPPAGMGQFIERLHARLVERGVSFTFGRTVASIDPRVPTVIATGASAAARLIEPVSNEVGAALARVDMLPLTTATAFFPPDPGDTRAFGVLFPREAGFRALGVLFNSEIFPGRSDVRSETWISSGVGPGEDVAAAVAEDRRRLTGRAVDPLQLSVTAWAEAVPRYDEAILAVRRALARGPLTNLTVAGNFVGQIGVAGLLESADDAVRSLLSPGSPCTAGTPDTTGTRVRDPPSSTRFPGVTYPRVRPLSVRFGAAVLLVVFAVGCAPRRVEPLDGAATSRCHDLRDPDGAPAGVAIAWRRPSADGQDGRRAPATWCAAIGPAVAVPNRPASPRTEAGIDAIAVVTWNVHVGGGDIVGFVQALRAGRFTNGAPVPEVILLVQEAFRSSRDVPDPVPPGATVRGAIRAAPPQGPRQDVVRAAAVLEMSLVYVPSMRNGATAAAGGEPEDRGNAVLATRALTDLAAIELPFERQRRVAVAATVSGMTTAGTPWTVRAVSTHFDASAGARHLWMFASGVRATQARVLAGALGDERSVVVGGDLNTWADGPFERAPRLLARAFNDTPPVKLQPTFGPLLLDYLFFRLPDNWRAESQRLDSTFGSDHRPVLGWIHFSQGKTHGAAGGAGFSRPGKGGLKPAPPSEF